MILMLGMAGSASSQKCGLQYGHFEPDQDLFLYGDKVNVRSTPSTSGAVVSNLPAGHPIMIDQADDATFAMGGYSTNWYRVVYKESGQDKAGYVWGGLISMATAELENPGAANDQFVCSISSWSQEKNFVMTARVIRGGKILTSLDFEPISSGFFDAGVFGHGVCVTVDGNHGFKGVRNVIRLEFNYEACGYENGEIFILWDGSKLTWLGKASTVVEGGVFAYTYELFFPDDPVSGSPGILKVLQTYEEYYYPEGDQQLSDVANLVILEDGSMMIMEKTLKSFSWDGTKVTVLPEKEIIDK